MGRTILGAVIGAVVWMGFALGLGILLGMLWPALAAASREPLTLTTPMLFARLAISFTASIASGAAAARFGGMNGAIAAGLLLLVCWGTYHVTMIWHLFPVWYHLTFLVSLPLLSWFGERFAPLPASNAPA